MSAVEFEIRGHCAWITINRPEQRNIMNAEVFVRLSEAWQQVREDDAIRVVVLTAAGTEDFSCGGDLGGIMQVWTGARPPADAIEQALLDNPLLVDEVMLKGQPLYKPVIAAINGRALGGGCEIIQAADIRIASSNAIFALPEPKSGLVPGAGSMVRLARQISYANAMQMLLTGEPVSAERALAMGLISEVVAPCDLLGRAEQLALQVAANAPLALQAIKKTVLQSHTLPWSDAFAVEMSQAAAVMQTEDAREGPRAFKQKRIPQFKGK